MTRDLPGVEYFQLRNHFASIKLLLLMSYNAHLSRLLLLLLLLLADLLVVLYGHCNCILFLFS